MAESLNPVFFQNMKGTMNALITKMKMGEHEHDEAVNVDELKWRIFVKDSVHGQFNCCRCYIELYCVNERR